MSKISQLLKKAAAAQRVSLESTDEAVQGQTGELNEQELAAIASKSAAEVTDETTADGAAEPAAAEGDTAAAPVTGADIDAITAEGDEPAADAAAEPATDVVADAGADVSEEVNEEVTDAAAEAEAVEEVADIQTPTETEVAEEQAAAADTGSIEAEAAADAIVEETAGETADVETTEEATGEEPATDAAVEGEEGGELDAVLEDTAAGTDEVATDGEIASGDVAVDGDVTDVAADAGVVDATDAGAEAGAEEAVADAFDGAAAAAEEIPAGEPEVTDAVDSTAAEATPETQEAAEPAEAAAPGPRTDASETVQEVVELTEAIAQASSAEDVVKQARAIGDDLQEVADTAEVINETGGVTMESLAMLQLALRPHLATLERAPLNLGVSLESFQGTPVGSRQLVSLEDIQDLIAEMDYSQPYLERQAIESLDRVVSALGDALPTACDRLKAVISTATLTKDDNEGASVQVDDGLAAALSVNGSLPADMANELQTYALLGTSLLNGYTDTAFRSAKAASLMTNAVDYSSVQAFWSRVDGVVEEACDPRCSLTATQLESCLPGGVKLFAEAQPEIDAPNPVLKKLFAFNTSYAPLEAMVATKSEGGESTYPALSASKIVLVGKALLELLCCEKIAERLSEGQKLWPEAQDSIRHLRENLRNAPSEIDSAIGADFSQVVKFVETQYSLATWPLVNFLTNAVLTVNAFVLLAERSLKAKPEAEDASVTEQTEEVVTEEPAVDGELQVSTESVVSSAVWSFIFGPIATAVLGSKAQNRQNELKALRKKLEAKQAAINAQEAKLVQLAKKAAEGVKAGQPQVSTEGFTGALKGGLLGVLAYVVPGVGTAILGGAYASQIENTYRDIEAARKELKALEVELAAKEQEVLQQIQAAQKSAS